MGESLVPGCTGANCTKGLRSARRGPYRNHHGKNVTQIRLSWVLLPELLNYSVFRYESTVGSNLSVIPVLIKHDWTLMHDWILRFDYGCTSTDVIDRSASEPIDLKDLPVVILHRSYSPKEWVVLAPLLFGARSFPMLFTWLQGINKHWKHWSPDSWANT
jgi:hypothetical protein